MVDVFTALLTTVFPCVSPLSETILRFLHGFAFAVTVNLMCQNIHSSRNRLKLQEWDFKFKAVFHLVLFGLPYTAL